MTKMTCSAPGVLKYVILKRLSLAIFRQRKILRQIAYFFVCKRDVGLDGLLKDDSKSNKIQ